jgi:hypothetical protein
MKRLVVVPAILILVLTVIPVYAQSTLPLQEKCAEGAKQFVERLDNVATYNPHYNKKLDQCFIRVGFYFGQTKENIKLGNGKTATLNHPQWMVALYNVFDGKMLGNCTYSGMEKEECWIEKQQYNTIDEFEKRIRPYMEE